MELLDRVRKAREYEEAVYGELRENPINLDDLFQTVVNAVHYHYAGYEQKKEYFTPAEYHTYIYTNYRYNTLTYQMLVRSLHQFVSDMHDRSLKLKCDDWIDYQNLAMKYRVRACDDVLYVTEADEETGLKKGDQILEIQSLTPDRVRKLTRNNCFFSREKERELWGGYLRMARSLKVRHPDGRVEQLKMKLFPLAEEAVSPEDRCKICFRDLTGMFRGGRDQTVSDGEADDNRKIICLQFERMDTEKIHALIREHEEEISSADILIIDLRRCIGGEEEAGRELFPYLTDRERKMQELEADDGSYVFCTKENCAARIAQFENYLTENTENLSDEERQLIMSEIRFYRENAGKGMVFREPEPEIEPEVIYPAEKAPGKVVILTDTFCEQEGERFAAMCRRCGPKVCLIGRPTMGTLDYFDCIELQLLEHMTLSYPISMTKAAYEGRGISEKGLPVDFYIPWTPEELKTDIILEQAVTKAAKQQQ